MGSMRGQCWKCTSERACVGQHQVTSCLPLSCLPAYQGCSGRLVSGSEKHSDINIPLALAMQNTIRLTSLSKQHRSDGE